MRKQTLDKVIQGMGWILVFTLYTFFLGELVGTIRAFQLGYEIIGFLGIAAMAWFLLMLRRVFIILTSKKS